MKKPEPVAIQGVVQAILMAILAAGEQFNIFALTEGQVNAVLGLLAAVFVGWSFYTRSKVTPV